jgi:sugar phosphate isomerase/epimerase
MTGTWPHDGAFDEGGDLMRVGVSSGPLPFEIDALDERVAAKVRDLGFSGVVTHFGLGGVGPAPTGARSLDPAELDSARLRRTRALLESYGLRVVQSAGWYPTLVDPDPAAHRRQVERFQDVLRVAADLGADMILWGGGSHNPHGPYAPHRENHSAASLDTLTAMLAELVPTAEHFGVVVALEPHTLTVLDTPERVRDVIDAVASPMVRVNLDPVNFVSCLGELYDSGALIDRVFDCLGEVAVSGHVKDVDVENGLVLHLGETVIGDGAFDLRRYLAKFEQLLPDGYLIVEHLPEELVPRAKSALDGLVDELGIAYR